MVDGISDFLFLRSWPWGHRGSWLLQQVSQQCLQGDPIIITTRVAGLGRLSAGANMAMKPFVKRVITIFATNASFLRVISNFRI